MKEWIMKNRKFLTFFAILTMFAISAFSIDGVRERVSDVEKNSTDRRVLIEGTLESQDIDNGTKNRELIKGTLESQKVGDEDKGEETESSAEIKDIDSIPFEKRFVYFDRSLAQESNYKLLLDLIDRAKSLGFNGVVISQEYVFSRLSHKNPIIDKIKGYLSEIEKKVHQNGMELIVMHFSAEVPNTVVHDGDEGNPFYKNGEFDFSEANKAVTIYKVQGDNAVTDAKEIEGKKSLIDSLYHFEGVKPNTEYKITLNATTEDFKDGRVKVSVLDEDHKGENGKVLFGIDKHFLDVKPNSKEREYVVYFNSLNHKNTNGKIKIYLAYGDGLKVNSLTIKEVGYVKSEHVISRDHTPILEGKRVYKEGEDYKLGDDGIKLLSDEIKSEKSLKLTWYPRVNVSRPANHLPKADACADEELFQKIMKDQYDRAKSVFNDKVDSVALYIDEWREAGWNPICPKLYESDFNASGDREFTGGDYIGITTKRMIESIGADENSSKFTFYIMSDMFDPNFNAKDPYMGVNGDAKGALKYLPKDRVVMFNWFPNPNEPGLEDKSMKDFLKSAEYFADNGVKQMIAGYHDDMGNLDANIGFYKESDKKTKESIVGFMFLIWHQLGKNPTYDDMDDVVRRICEDLPGKWPNDGCKEAKKQN
jgi:hypothetical protein